MLKELRRLFFASILLFFVAYVQADTPPDQAQKSSSASKSDSRTSCLNKIPTPISIPVRNVTLDDGTLRRGAALSVGTPSQALAFAVNPIANNTNIYDSTAPCNDEDSRPQCSARFGGLFDKGKSSSFTSYNNNSAPGFVGPLPDWFISGTDTFKVTDKTSLIDFPVGISRITGGFDHSPHINILGLASSSSLLTALSKKEEIASRSFGYWGGLNGAEAKYQIDGNLVLGGYDQAKINGPNVTMPITNAIVDCESGLVVPIADIEMNLKNGSNISIMGEQLGSSFKACVKPDQDSINFAHDIWANFVDVSGVKETKRTGAPLHYWTMNVEAETAYDGDLTITVYPNLQIRVPNHQLVLPDYDVDSRGNIVEMNSSNRNIVIYSLQDVQKNALPALGNPFLSSAYFFVDYEQKSFTLWQSNATTNSNLRPVGPPECKSELPPPAPSSSVGPQPSSSSSVADRPGKSNSTAAIAGGIVGGLAALAFIVITIVILRRRRRKGQDIDIQSLGSKDPLYKQPEYLYSKAEMPTDRLPPQEMPLERNPPYRLAPHELMVRANNRGTLHELPSFGAQYSLPPTPKRPRRTKSTDGNFDIGSI